MLEGELRLLGGGWLLQSHLWAYLFDQSDSGFLGRNILFLLWLFLLNWLVRVLSQDLVNHLSSVGNLLLVCSSFRPAVLLPLKRVAHHKSSVGCGTRE
jgi:hypothetical protein